MGGVVGSVEHIKDHRPAVEFFHSNKGERGEANLVREEGLDVCQGDRGPGLHGLRLLDGLLQLLELSVPGAHYGKRGQSFPEDKAIATWRVVAEHVIHEFRGGHGRRGGCVDREWGLFSPSRE
jgi:hypothetical protein